MAKRAKKIEAPDEADLRRWCIEQAIRWPVAGTHPYAQQAGALGYVGGEADVLGRAGRILSWVKTR